MSNTSKLVTIGVIVVVAVGAWWYMGNFSQTGTSKQQTAAENSSAPTGTQNTSGTSAGPTVSASASTDAALQQDAGSIDTQISDLNSDTASADQGLSNQ